MGPSPLVRHLEAMALGWEKVAVFGSEASCKVTMFMTRLALWCKPHRLLLISVGCPTETLCPLWTVCVMIPRGNSGHPRAAASLAQTLAVLQGNALLLSHCKHVHNSKSNMLKVGHTLMYLKAHDVLCHQFKEIPLALAGSWKQLITHGWHVQLLLMYGNRREIRFNWFSIMNKVAFISL